MSRQGNLECYDYSVLKEKTMKNLNNPAYKATGPKTVFLKWSIDSMLGWPASVFLSL